LATHIFSLEPVDVFALKLWKVSIPVNDGFKENARKVERRDKEAFSLVDPLLDVLTDPPAEAVLESMFTSL